MSFTPTKLYYKIGEACEIVGVEAHVLRFWETEFPSLAPPKNRGGQRTYRPRDIEVLLMIRKLLYEDGFTIAGARKQLSREILSRPESALPIKTTRRASIRARSAPEPRDRKLNQVRKELESILTLLERE